MRKLKDIVEEYMREEERLDDAYYFLYLDYAISGLRDLHYDVSGVIKQAKITVNTSNNTVNLPPDLIKLIGVSAFDGSKLVALSRNNNIFKNLDDCGNPTGSSNSLGTGNSDLFGFPSSARHFRDGSVIGAFYGLGSTSNFGEYRYNKEYNRIELSTYTAISHLIVEYLADVSQINGEFIVHEYLVEPIKNWIDWVSKRRKNIVSAGEKQLLEDQYTRSKRKARIRLSSISIAEMQDLSRRTFSQAPKF